MPFQRKDIDFTTVKPLVSRTNAVVDSLLLTPEFFSSLPAVVVDVEQSDEKR